MVRLAGVEPVVFAALALATIHSELLSQCVLTDIIANLPIPAGLAEHQLVDDLLVSIRARLWGDYFYEQGTMRMRTS
jgi:hypothetical protein